MRFWLEGRVPFLDQELVQLRLQPAGRRDHQGRLEQAGAARRDARTCCPTSINRRRNKIGFTTPQGEWFMRLKNHIYGDLPLRVVREPALLRPDRGAARLRGVDQGHELVDSMTFWRMLNLELWLQEFFDEREPEDAGRAATSRPTTSPTRASSSTS